MSIVKILTFQHLVCDSHLAITLSLKAWEFS
jgi:hypothetical protein